MMFICKALSLMQGKRLHCTLALGFCLASSTNFTPSIWEPELPDKLQKIRIGWSKVVKEAHKVDYQPASERSKVVNGIIGVLYDLQAFDQAF